MEDLDGQAQYRWLSTILGACFHLLDQTSVAARSTFSSIGICVQALRDDAARFISAMVAGPSTQPLSVQVGTLTASVLALIVPAMTAIYVVFLRRSSQGPTPGFKRLRSKEVGIGKEGKKWTVAPASSAQIRKVQGGAAGDTGNDGSINAGDAVTWLGENELRVLEALADTLLPGFEVDTTEGADAVVEEAVALMRSKIFQGNTGAPGAAGTSCGVLPPAAERYTRSIARRCLRMHGRPASDVGVAGLLAQAFESNISHEQREGLRVLLWVLSTRLGALLLTGRAVPIAKQGLAARHALLKRWSVSRVGQLRGAFQGIKRLSCSLYFSAHPEAAAKSSSESKAVPNGAIAEAYLRTNPNWNDIRYEPQHHRLSREPVPSAASSSSASTIKPGLWSGAKVKVAQAARAVSSPNRRYSNPPSPCTAGPSPFSFESGPSSSSANAPTKFFPHPRSASTGHSNLGFSGGTSGASDGPGGSDFRGSGFKKSTTGNGGFGQTRQSKDSLPSKINVDVVVVGSGAGGGCAAGALAAKGLKVAVLEKGGLYDTADFAGFSEMEAYRELYEGHGILVTEDGAIVILAGSCVGGGTTVNWAASFRTPRHVRLEWAKRLGLKSFEFGGPYDKALDAVCERLGVNTDQSHRAPGCPSPRASLRVNQHQSSLWNGAVASGKVPKPVPRNAKGCSDCGSCLHGCAFGNKRSTHATWLQDGLDAGNIILVPNAKVDQVLTDAGRATGVTATISAPGGGKATSLTVLARAVVVAGGAIHTPAILLRSGFKHPLIGRHLCLHPAMIVGGVFPENYVEGSGDAWKDGGDALGGSGRDENTTASGLSPPTVGGTRKSSKAKALADWKSKADAGQGTPGIGPRAADLGRGVMMGVYVQDCMKLDKGYGCVIEAPPSHPGLMGTVMPWNDAISHRLSVAMSRESSVFLCIGRDRSSEENRIVLGPRGDPVIKYKIGKEDSGVILQGRSEMLRLMRKAGASILLPAHEGAPWFCSGSNVRETDSRFEEYVEHIESLDTTPNQAGIYSAHQMGSCRLGATPQDGPLRETGESWECDGLFVADASVLPTSLGINPMITVEAVAYMVADQVATRLGKEAPSSVVRAESSPLRRKLSSFGKAVVAVLSRDASAVESEPVVTLDHLPGDGNEDNIASALGAAGAGGVAAAAAHGNNHGGNGWRQRSVGIPGRANSRSPCRVARGNSGGAAPTVPDDDFGVDLSKLSW